MEYDMCILIFAEVVSSKNGMAFVYYVGNKGIWYELPVLCESEYFTVLMVWVIWNVCTCCGIGIASYYASILYYASVNSASVVLMWAECLILWRYVCSVWE